jgi:hypothetical protein
VSNDPFSRQRARRDLVSALPAVGMILSAVLVLGLFLRWVLDRG